MSCSLKLQGNPQTEAQERHNMTATAGKCFIAGILFSAIAGLAVTGDAIAAAAQDHGKDAPTLRLNAGNKWQTDAPLRQGMSAIRSAVQRALPAAQAGRYPDKSYQALGTEVEKQIAFLVQNCTLTPQADDVLHEVITEMMAGVEVIKGQKGVGDRSTGVIQLVKALDNYGVYFNHPGWKPVAR